MSDDGHAAAAESWRASRQLGQMIKAARRRLGYSQAELGDMIGCGQSKIGKVEIGYRSISAKDVEPLIENLKYSSEEAESFRHLAHVAGTMRSDESTGKWPLWFTDHRGLELSATAIRSWTGERLPGILHSEFYMMAMFSASGEILDASDLIRGRKDRRRLLDRDVIPECEYIISYSFLLRLRGSYSASVALDQVEHLIKVMERYRTISVLILPFEAHLAFTPEDFTIFTVPDNDPTEVAWTENAHTGKKIIKTEDVNLYHDRWNQVREACLNRNESHLLLDKHRAELRNQP